jgi:hypothetical protein
LEHRVIGRDVRRIADDEIEALLRERLEPTAGVKDNVTRFQARCLQAVRCLHAGRCPQTCCIGPSDAQSGFRSLDGMHLPSRSLEGEREGDGP